MKLEQIEKSSNVINPTILGEGNSSVKIAGEDSLPFLHREGKSGNRPIVAYEVFDSVPSDWPKSLKDEFKGVINKPIEWASFCKNELNAQVICLRLAGVHPDFGNASAQDSAKLCRDIYAKVNLPLVVIGCGDDQRDNKILPECSKALKGKNCFFGNATIDNHKTLVASCIADGNGIIAQSPIDINIAKQLNILISEVGLPLDKIIINSTVGALGYGLEYAYSIMERARLAALMGDKMLAMPFICFIGQESWRAKESKASVKSNPDWGNEYERGVNWEAVTANAFLHAGADILVMRHPKAGKIINSSIHELSKKGIT